MEMVEAEPRSRDVSSVLTELVHSKLASAVAIALSIVLETLASASLLVL